MAQPTTVEMIRLDSDGTYRHSKAEVGDRVLMQHGSPGSAHVFSREKMILGHSRLGRIIPHDYEKGEDLLTSGAGLQNAANIGARGRFVLVTGNDPYCVGYNEDREELLEHAKNEAQTIVQVERMRAATRQPGDYLNDERRRSMLLVVALGVFSILAVFSMIAAYQVFLAPGL